VKSNKICTQENQQNNSNPWKISNQYCHVRLTKLEVTHHALLETNCSNFGINAVMHYLWVNCNFVFLFAKEWSSGKINKITVTCKK